MLITRCKLISIYLLLVNSTISVAQIPSVSTGTLQHILNFTSKYVAPHNVDVWLPDGYTTNKKYAVLYMQDGMALFDGNIMWNKQEWGVDETLGCLLREGKVKDCIVVGVWNVGAGRHSEYFPQKPFEMLPKHLQDSLYNISTNGIKLFAGKVSSDNYLKYLVKELKPYIDEHYATLTSAANTFVAGSSMGGLISLYAICQYPKIFGGAACLSTHWTGTFTASNNPIPAAFITYLSKHLPSAKNHKIYFDHGDQTLDALYAPFQLQADAIMRLKGYKDGNFLSLEYPGADHSEKSWSKRLDVPLMFLLQR